MEEERSLVSRLFLISETSRIELAGSVIELSCPSGFEGSKKTSVGSLNFLFDGASEARLERASLRRLRDWEIGRD